MSDIKEVKIINPYSVEDNVLEFNVDTDGDGYLLEDVVSLIGTYTFSIWVKGKTDCEVLFDILGTNKFVNVTTSWQKITHTVTINSLLNKNIRFYPNINTTTYYYEGSLVEGIIDNSWLPSPEDIDGEITSVKSELIQTAESIELKITASDGRITSLETSLEGIKSEVKNAKSDISSLKQTATDISAEIKDARGNKASLKLAIDGLKSEISSVDGKVSTVDQKADGIQLQVDDNKKKFAQLEIKANEISSTVQGHTKEISKIKQDASEISSTVQNHTNEISQIKQKAGEIELSVSNVKDNLTNNYYNKEEADAKFTIEADKITSTVTSKINVGNRNLLLKSDTVYTNSLYEIATYQIVEKMKSGTKYTCTIWGNLASGKTDFSISLNGSTQLGKLTKESDGLYSLTFDGIQDSSESSLLYVYANPSSYQNTSTINKIKLSYGNTKTDWSPAVEEKLSTEDFNEIINGDNGIIDQIENSKSEITQLSNSISTLVTDENGSSLMTQTPDGWQFNIGGINKKIDEAKKDIDNNKTSIENTDKYVDIIQKQQEAIEAKTAIINFTSLNGQPAILLGQTNNSFKLRITNTSIDFLDGSTVVAYISNKVLYIEKAIVKNEIQIGEGAGFVFKRRTNGNMGIRFAKGVIV